MDTQISPFARWTARNQFERLRKVYNGADAQLSSPFLTVSTTTEGRVGLPVKPASVFDEGAWQVFNEKWNDFEEGRPRRMLQGTCDGEFTITSNVAPVLEGCFQNTASETTSTFNGQEVYGIVPDGQGSATTLVYAFVVDTAFDSLVSIGVRGAIYFEHTLAPRCKSFGQRMRFVFPCLDRCRAVVIYF